MTSQFFREILLTGDRLLLQGCQGGEGQGDPFSILLPLLAVVVIFWFLVFRPEHKQRKERERKVQSLKKGDRVVTTGGILGEVTKVEENEVVLRVDKDKDIRLRFAKSAVFDIRRSESRSESMAEAGESTG
jgi:preprotein translocase subunit YajC